MMRLFDLIARHFCFWHRTEKPDSVPSTPELTEEQICAIMRRRSLHRWTVREWVRWQHCPSDWCLPNEWN